MFIVSAFTSSSAERVFSVRTRQRRADVARATRYFSEHGRDLFKKVYLRPLTLQDLSPPNTTMSAPSLPTGNAAEVNLDSPPNTTMPASSFLANTARFNCYSPPDNPDGLEKWYSVSPLSDSDDNEVIEDRLFKNLLFHGGLGVWKERYPDPAESPAKHTRNLWFHNADKVTDDDADRINKFTHVEHLEVITTQENEYLSIQMPTVRYDIPSESDTSESDENPITESLNQRHGGHGCIDGSTPELDTSESDTPKLDTSEFDKRHRHPEFYYITSYARPIRPTKPNGPFTPFHNFSPSTLKSLTVGWSVLPSQQVFSFICSLPNLENLYVRGFRHIVGEDWTVSESSSLPPLNGTFVFGPSTENSFLYKLSKLPICHFRNIIQTDATYRWTGSSGVEDLINACSATLERVHINFRTSAKSRPFARCDRFSL